MDLASAVLIGLVAGLGAGLTGIGGGTLMVPASVFLLGFPQHLAQGTSLLAVMFTSTSGTIVNRRNGNVDVRLALTIGTVGAIMSFTAARVASVVDDATLRRAFGVFVLLAGSRSLIQAIRERRGDLV